MFETNYRYFAIEAKTSVRTVALRQIEKHSVAAVIPSDHLVQFVVYGQEKEMVCCARWPKDWRVRNLGRVQAAGGRIQGCGIQGV